MDKVQVLGFMLKLDDESEGDYKVYSFQRRSDNVSTYLSAQHMSNDTWALNVEVVRFEGKEFDDIVSVTKFGYTLAETEEALQKTLTECCPWLYKQLMNVEQYTA